MAWTVGHEAVEHNFELKYGDDINYSWTILDSDSSAYSFTNKTDSDLNLYRYKGGAVKKNYGEDASEGLSYSSNVVTWNGVWGNLKTAFNLEPGDVVYYEHTYEDSGTTNPSVILPFGYIKFN